MSVIIQSKRRAVYLGALGAVALAGLVACAGCGAGTREPSSQSATPSPQAEPPAEGTFSGAPVAESVAESAPESAPEPTTQSGVHKEPYGEHNGEAVHLYTLTNHNQWVLKATNYGAIITEFHVPDRTGQLADVVLGYGSLKEYEKETPYFGATIGRVANRIKNAAFELEGTKYRLAANDNPNFLHGGKQGFDKVVWHAKARDTSLGPQITFTYTSVDGEEGFPGTVQATTTYTLTHKNELLVEMRAVTDKTTLVNMAHHSYWNLGGHKSGTILDHELTLMASSYTPAVGLVPDGRVKPVRGTPFDFTAPKLIGTDVKAVGGDPVGFDHNWIIDGEPQELRPMARLKHPASGRVMTLSANQPALQFYSGNFLDGTLTGKDGAVYPQYSGLCLESQKSPNSINVPQWRDDVILKPGEEYVHTMVHAFSVE